jgi:chemotaxis response regulator CheB
MKVAGLADGGTLVVRITTIRLKTTAVLRRLPFRSLATRAAAGFGVIMTGMGNDGTSAAAC